MKKKLKPIDSHFVVPEIENQDESDCKINKENISTILAFRPSNKYTHKTNF